MMPSLSVVHTVPSLSEEGSPGALLAAESAGAVEEAVHEPFEAHGNLAEPPPEVRGDAVDHGCGDQRFSHRRIPLHPGRFRKR